MKPSCYDPLGIGVGTLIAKRYEIESKLGAGGMSAVYKVRDLALNKQVCALKLLEPRLISNPKDLDRFRSEVLITRKLTHPNIVRTFEFGKTDTGQYYITMEYVPGHSLHQVIYGQTERELRFDEILRYLYEIAKGIAHAHSAGVVHRDLKPANLLVCEDGSIKITDFGLAQTKELELQLTQAGECVGTPAYMAPEQVQGKEADARSDIYALGIIAYELVTGNLPFSAKDWFNLASQIINQPLPSFQSFYKNLPGWFHAFILKATAKKADERWSSAQEIAELFERHLHDTEQLVFVRKRQGKAKKPVINWGSQLVGALASNGPLLMILCTVLTLFLVVVGTGAGRNSLDNAAANMTRGTQSFNKIVEGTAKEIHNLNQAMVEAQKNREAWKSFVEQSKEDKKLREKLLKAGVLVPPEESEEEQTSSDDKDGSDSTSKVQANSPKAVKNTQ